MAQQAATESLDAHVFRRITGLFATGVAVLSTRADDKDYAITANSLASVSLDPPLILCCLMENSRFHAQVMRAGFWAVSILGADQEGVAQWCSRPGRAPELQLCGVRVSRGDTTGAPIVDASIAGLECRTWATMHAGDHTIIVGQVLSGWRSLSAGAASGPLVFFAGGYHTSLRRSSGEGMMAQAHTACAGGCTAAAEG